MLFEKNCSLYILFKEFDAGKGAWVPTLPALEQKAPPQPHFTLLHLRWNQTNPSIRPKHGGLRSKTGTNPTHQSVASVF